MMNVVRTETLRGVSTYREMRRSMRRSSRGTMASEKSR